MVAHSAAGLLLPTLARRLDARHQVWLAAAVADYRGQRSLFEELRHDPRSVFQAEWLGIDPTTDPVLATYFALRTRARPGAPFVFNTGLNLVGLCAGSQSGSRTLAEVVAKVAAAEFGYVRPPRPAEEQ